MSVQWDLTMVLVCISLNINSGELTVLIYDSYTIFSEIRVQMICLFFSSVVYLVTYSGYLLCIRYRFCKYFLLGCRQIFFS